jgi:hypothetical protein
VGADGQAMLPGVSDDLYRAVQMAVQSLPAIPRLIQNGQISEAIYEQFPDPAVRDTVMVAARRLAPSARNKAISELYLNGPQPDDDLGPPLPGKLTPLQSVHFSPGGLMEQSDASLQRGGQG